MKLLLEKGYRVEDRRVETSREKPSLVVQETCSCCSREFLYIVAEKDASNVTDRCSRCQSEPHYVVCVFRPGMDCKEYESEVHSLRAFDDLACAEYFCAEAQGYADRFYQQDMPVGWEEYDLQEWLDQQHWMIDAIVHYEIRRRLEAEGFADNRYEPNYNESRHNAVKNDVEHEVGSFFNPNDPNMWGNALCRPEYFVKMLPAN